MALLFKVLKRMTKILTFVIFLTLSLLAMSQEKSDNNDLRGQKRIFSISEKINKSNIIYEMVSSSSGQFNFQIQKKNKVDKSVKVSGDEVRRVDDNFVDKFITLKYMMGKSSEKNCKKAYSLSLRGEKQKICTHEKEKIDMVKKIIRNLKESFK